MVSQLIQNILKGMDVRQSLSSLKAAIKEEENYKKAKELLGDAKAVADLLDDSDPKVRKNAAALLGDLKAKEQADALYHAYKKEGQMFVRSIYLKALAKTDASPYIPMLKEQYDALIQYKPKEEEKKHVSEELRALEQILRQQENTSHTFSGWNKKLLIFLTTGPAFQEVTGKQLSGEKISYNSLGVRAVVDNLRDVVKIRTFRELLFPLAIKEEITTDSKPQETGAALISSNLLALLEKCHKEPGPFYFRLEVRCGMDLKERSLYAKKAAHTLEELSGRKLVNSTDDYEFEVRLLAGKEGKLHGFLKMNTIPMERFFYRVHIISASIHPSLAALLMELSAPYLKERGNVLDPCCGVGTMLVERCKKIPAGEVYGVDIYGEAIAGAKENIKLAGISANLIKRDYFEFQHKYLFDEIIANLPMRGKKTKEEQDMFYRDFFKKSKEHLVKGGIMVLYCNENAFVKKQLRLHPEFHLVKEFEIRPKDGFTLSIIRAGE